MSGLFESRRFWLALLDVVVSSVTYFGAKYLGPAVFEDIKFLIAAFQPVILLVIAAYTVDKFAPAEA
jgi:hypothetical protein